LQLKEKELHSDILDDFIKSDILKRQEVIEFLTNANVI